MQLTSKMANMVVDFLPREKFATGEIHNRLDAQSCYFHGQNSIQTLHQQKRFSV